MPIKGADNKSATDQEKAPATDQEKALVNAPAELSDDERHELAALRAEKRDREEAEAEANRQAQPDADEEVYLHLANGDVERVKTSELPGTAGTNALHGFWTKDGYTHQVIGVYPVETKKGK